MTTPRCECVPGSLRLCYWCAHRRRKQLVEEPICICFQQAVPCEKCNPPQTAQAVAAEARWEASRAAQPSERPPLRGRIVEPWEPLPRCGKCAGRNELRLSDSDGPALRCINCGFRRVVVVSGRAKPRLLW